MNSPLLTAYFRFLQVARTLTEAQETALSANHRALLEAVVLAWHEGQPLSVRQAISLESLGSPATLHKRLSTLRSAGYLTEISVEGDRRTKLLGPTSLALDYFAQLGDAMALPMASA
jgi:hypothetical protein